MTPIQECFKIIESPKFDFELSVVSSSEAFFRAVSEHPTVLQAYGELRRSAEYSEYLLDRIYDLSREEIDLEYANPNDTALTTLLWLAYYTDGDCAINAAKYITQAPRCWYATELAHRVLTFPQNRPLLATGLNDEYFTSEWKAFSRRDYLLTNRIFFWDKPERIECGRIGELRSSLVQNPGQTAIRVALDSVAEMELDSERVREFEGWLLSPSDFDVRIKTGKINSMVGMLEEAVS